MSSTGNKPSVKYWHQGFIIGEDSKGRDCLRFQTYGIALRVSQRALANGFRLAIYEDGGDWCLRLLAKGEGSDVL